MTNNNISDNSSVTSSETKKKRGRPKKYFTEEERKKAKYNSQKGKYYYENFKAKNSKFICETCNISMSSYSKWHHLKTKSHRLNELELKELHRIDKKNNSS